MSLPDDLDSLEDLFKKALDLVQNQRTPPISLEEVGIKLGKGFREPTLRRLLNWKSSGKGQPEKTHRTNYQTVIPLLQAMLPKKRERKAAIKTSSDKFITYTLYYNTVSSFKA